jgi:hypothetical protein
MRYKIVLPITILVLSVALFKIADLQFQALIQQVKADTGRGLHEGLPEDFTHKARYISYIISAPAWAASVHMPWIFHFNVGVMGIDWNERDCWYLFFSILLWFIVGALLDKRKNGGLQGIAIHKVSPAVVGFLAVGYGIFVCYSSIEFSRSPWNFELWFTLPVFFWGIVLTVFGLYAVRSRKGIETQFPSR